MLDYKWLSKHVIDTYGFSVFIETTTSHFILNLFFNCALLEQLFKGDVPESYTCRLTDDTSCLQKEDIDTDIAIKDVERLPRNINTYNEICQRFDII